MALFAIFVAVPLIEIALFIQIGGLIGLWPTLGIVVLTAILGTWLVRSQARRSSRACDNPSTGSTIRPSLWPMARCSSSPARFF